MQRFTFVMIVAIVSGLSGCNKSPSATTAQSGDAKSVLRKLADFYQQKQSFQVDYEQKFVMELNGVKNAVASQSKITVERPNRIAIRLSGSQPGTDIISDGKQISINLGALKQYSQSPAPQTFEDLLANPLLIVGSGGRGPLLDLFSSDPYMTLMAGVTEATNLGREKVADVDVDHLKLVQPQFEWEIWVTAEAPPRVVQAKFDLSKSLTASGNTLFKDAKMVVTQQYKNWQFDVNPPESAFAFEPTAGYKKVDNFFGAGTGGEAEQSSPLVGKPAPDIEQELLEGGHFSLKGLQNEKVVILDFWATWCGPCVREMPILAKVADEYRDRGVALYCINQQEGAGVIRKFLHQKGLNVAVGLDSTGEASQAYNVEGIPMLVVIDKGGIVQSVHVGFSPNIGQTLKRELDTILDEKALTKSERTGNPTEANESEN